MSLNNMLKVGLVNDKTPSVSLRKGVKRSPLFSGSSEGRSTSLLQSQSDVVPSASVSDTHDSTDSISRRKPIRGKEKKCIKCREIKPIGEFGYHGNTEDGLQTICRTCKNERATERRNQNVRARLHHHIATRVASQLGNQCPRDITKTLEARLGYRIQTLVRHLRERMQSDYEGKKLRDALNEGWHVDHIHPLSKFTCVTSSGEVDWDEFQRCWDISNLVCVPADVNLAKGAKVIGDQAGKEGKEGKPF